MDWNDIRIFLAIYHSGTLRGAGRLLGVDQTTVGRRITALEARLEAKLFLRSNAGYVLTSAGEDALVAAQAMEHIAVSFQRRTEKHDVRVSGEVRVTTTDAIAADFVIPAIDRLRDSCPALRVILSTTTRVLDLGRRDADIAIRTVRPEHSDLIVRKLAKWDVGLYASRCYLERRGMPRPGHAFEGHDLAIYQPAVTQNQDGTLGGESIAKGNVIAELDSSLMLSTVVRSGMAIGELPTYLADNDTELVRIWPERKRAAPYEVWLVLHADLARTARVRVVVDAIVAAFKAAGEGAPATGRRGDG
ncbi:DNA-binding transcriptional LysR family regulator [Duganella sp. 1411]|uniref:LysR family transcriptional regulator n=1 Tax=Duganella sp. 1411 TaxID=2806572 RepID=UPI001AEB19B4|nr:LysR family transcriptional regulator [Duganella sp. 1411]MBP1208349.1 DNA-binding transcriptional LysR family regulator [Duganella sp. 1411]